MTAGSRQVITKRIDYSACVAPTRTARGALDSYSFPPDVGVCLLQLSY